VERWMFRPAIRAAEEKRPEKFERPRGLKSARCIQDDNLDVRGAPKLSRTRFSGIFPESSLKPFRFAFAVPLL